nr:MAG TPA: hypothetical protein [Caudoviricetes sp.]
MRNFDLGIRAPGSEFHREGEQLVAHEFISQGRVL